MTKLYINDECMMNKIIPLLENTIGNLNSVINKFETLNVPIDFEYFMYLKNLPSTIYNNKENLEKEKSKLELIVKEYNNIENINISEIENIKNFYLQQRKK